MTRKEKITKLQNDFDELLKQHSKTLCFYQSLHCMILNLQAISKYYTIEKDIADFCKNYDFLTVAPVGIGYQITLK